MKTLTVSAIEEKVSEEVAKKRGNGGRYKVISFKGPEMILGVDELGKQHIFHIPSKVTSQTIWVDSPIPGRDLPDYGHDFDIGQKVPGAIVTREVMPYFIPSANGNIVHKGVKGRMVTTASVIVFGVSDETEDWRMEVDKAFRSRNFILKGEGDMGAPGGNLQAAIERPQTRLEGKDPINQLPLALREEGAENPDAIVEYSEASREKNQDEGDTAR